MIEQVEPRRFLSATASLNSAELRIDVVSRVNTAIEVTYTNARIAVQVQDESASRRVYSGLRRAISSIRIVGSSAADRITLGEGIRATTVEAGGGKDVVIGNRGANVIYGGDGDDSLVGLDGDDIIYGGSGRDTIYGGLGNDTLEGGNDIDRLYGDDGNDLLRGGASRHADYLDGGLGIDRLLGTDSTDRIQIDSNDRYTDPDLNGDDLPITPVRG